VRHFGRYVQADKIIFLHKVLYIYT
jgi:hypothetical protein